MRRLIHIYQPYMSEEIGGIFESLNDNFSVLSFENDLLTILDEDYYNPEPVDIESFRELLIEDFSEDITMFIEPYMEFKFTLTKLIQEFLPQLPRGVFYFDDIIVYAVLKQHTVLKKEIIQYIQTRVNSEVIHTVREFIEYNMNSSVAAKNLYMHRNTLNYRVDNFIEHTKINVKTFRGANAVYMLYKF